MRLRNASMFAVGALLTVAAAASAQDTTRTRPKSQRRIPITKEAPGEVVAPRVDTVTVYRTDTLRVFRTDTVTTTMTRVDTVRMEPPMPMMPRRIGGLYFGIAGGADLPAANMNEPNKTGWRLEVPVGIDPIGSPLGLRVTGGYAQYDAHSWVGNAIDNSAMWNIDGDLKLRGGSFDLFSKRFELYAVGGASWNHFRDLVEVNRKTGQFALGDQIQTTSTFTAPDHDWHSKWGWNVGGGASLGWGSANLFVESRYNRFNGEITNLANVPLVIGFTWY